MDKTTLLIKKETIKRQFDELSAQRKEAEDTFQTVENEMFRLQGENRLLDELLKGFEAPVEQQEATDPAAVINVEGDTSTDEA